MFASILSLVLGALPTVISELAKARVDLANAKTESEKIAVQERIRVLEIQRDVLASNASSPWQAATKFCFAFPFLVYLNWIILWDKLGCKWFLVDAAACTTDPLSPWLETAFMTVLGGYFLITGIFKR